MRQVQIPQIRIDAREKASLRTFSVTAGDTAWQVT
jgi:hypothetical protein